MKQRSATKETIAEKPATKDSIGSKISKYFERNGYRNGLGGCCFDLGFVHKECSKVTHEEILRILEMILKKDELNSRKRKKLESDIAKLNTCAKKCGMEEIIV